jgi:hypothetical protein
MINESAGDGQSQGQARIKVAGKMVHQGAGPVVCKLLWGEPVIYCGQLPSPRSSTGTVIQQQHILFNHFYRSFNRLHASRTNSSPLSFSTSLSVDSACHSNQL